MAEKEGLTEGGVDGNGTGLKKDASTSSSLVAEPGNSREVSPSPSGRKEETPSSEKLKLEKRPSDVVLPDFKHTQVSVPNVVPKYCCIL